MAQLPSSESTQCMRCFLEAPPDVFHYDSSIPPLYSNPEPHCTDRDLSNRVEESRGVGVSFEINTHVEQVAQAEAFLHTCYEIACGAVIFSRSLEDLMLEIRLSSSGAAPSCQQVHWSDRTCLSYGKNAMKISGNLMITIGLACVLDNN